MRNSKVLSRVLTLSEYNRSMAVALARAAHGSSVEDSYFIEKLEKTANKMGYKLVKEN